MTSELPPKADPQARRAAIVQDLATRLRPACREWPDELFDSMIEGLADITLRYESQASANTYDRRTTDRLVSEMKEALQRNEDARNRSGS